MPSCRKRVTNLELYGARLPPNKIVEGPQPIPMHLRNGDLSSSLHYGNHKQAFLVHKVPTADHPWGRYLRSSVALEGTLIEEDPDTKRLKDIKEKRVGLAQVPVSRRIFAGMKAMSRLSKVDDDETKECFNHELQYHRGCVDSADPTEYIHKCWESVERTLMVGHGLRLLAFLPEEEREHYIKQLSNILGEEDMESRGQVEDALRTILKAATFGEAAKAFDRLHLWEGSPSSGGMEHPSDGSLLDSDGPEKEGHDDRDMTNGTPSGMKIEPYTSPRAPVKMEIIRYPLTELSTSEVRRRGFEIGKSGVDLSPRRLVQGALGVRRDIFRRRSKAKRPADGVVLIDASGSMDFTAEDIQYLLDVAPFATVAYYCGSTDYKGWLTIIAEGGRKVPFVPEPKGCNNSVDYQAMKWMFEQKGPYFMVTDKGWTGPEANMAEELHSTSTSRGKLIYLGFTVSMAIENLAAWREKNVAR